MVLRGGSVAADTVTGATNSNMNGFSMPPVRIQKDSELQDVVGEQTWWRSRY